jgi:hypothetical protein
MKLKWQIELNLDNNPWVDYNCLPYIERDEFIFATISLDKQIINPNNSYSYKVHIYRINIFTGKYITNIIYFKNQETYKRKLLLTKKWRFITMDNKIKLDTGIIVDIESLQPEMNLIAPKNTTITEIKDEYTFNDILLKYNQRSMIECVDMKTMLSKWHMKIIGYLYTHIEAKGKYLFWGTAGNGGAFYCIETESGKLISVLKNKGSSYYTWYNETVLLRDGKGSFIRYNPYTGEIMNSIKLNGQVLGNPIITYDNNAFVISHNRKKSSAYLNLVQIDNQSIM